MSLCFVLLLHFFISHAQIDTETMNIMIHHIFSLYLVDRTAFGPERRRRRGSSCLLLYESICKSSGPFPPYVRVVSIRTSRTYTTGASRSASSAEQRLSLDLPRLQSVSLPPYWRSALPPLPRSAASRIPHQIVGVVILRCPLFAPVGRRRVVPTTISNIVSQSRNSYYQIPGTSIDGGVAAAAQRGGIIVYQ